MSTTEISFKMFVYAETDYMAINNCPYPNDLIIAGWEVLKLTPEMLEDKELVAFLERWIEKKEKLGLIKAG